MDWNVKPELPLPATASLQPLQLPQKSGGGESLSVCGRLNHFLRPDQREGVLFLWDRFINDGGGILADDMGSGKTIQIIGLLSALYHKTGELSDNDQNREVVTGSRPVVPSLVVCPSSVLDNWAQEIRKWSNFVVKRFYKHERENTLKAASEGRCELVLTTFETTRENIEMINQVGWKLVVVDECHRIKEPKSAITQALKSINCARRFGLTGTALQNKYTELWCLLDWANPACLGSINHFQQEFSQPMTRGFRFDATKVDLATAREKQNELNELKSAWMLRRVKANTIGDNLPRKTDQIVFCSLSPFQLKVMESLVVHPDTVMVLKAWQSCVCGARRARINCCFKDMKNEDGVSPRKLILQLIHVFLKAANHAALLLPGQNSALSQTKLGDQLCRQAFRDQPKLMEDWKAGKFTAMCDTALSGKMTVLAGLLRVMDSQGDKVLLFSWSTKVLDILGMFLSSRGYTYRRLDGNTRQDARQKLVNEFNKDPGIFVFLVSTKAGGVGLNITGANAVIVFEPNWNPSHDLQAQDRAYRIGQTRDVSVYRLVSVGCIEEIIYLRQVYKQQLSSSSVDCETARRYFIAVQGDPARRGELFGIRNLFRVNPAGHSLTLDIEQRNRKMEERVRGRGLEGLCSIRANMLRDAEADEVVATDPEDPFMLGLDEELGEDHEPLSIRQVLAGKGVVHSHTNQTLVGPSRTEQHISACAIKDVETFGVVEAGNLPAQECEILTSTQCLSETPGDDKFPTASPEPEKTIQVGQTKRSYTKYSAGKNYVMGATPRAVRHRLFSEMARRRGVTHRQLAVSIKSMDFDAKIELLKDFHASSSDENIDSLLNAAKRDNDRKRRADLLRRISYSSSMPVRTAVGKKGIKLDSPSPHKSASHHLKPRLNPEPLAPDASEEYFSDDNLADVVRNNALSDNDIAKEEDVFSDDDDQLSAIFDDRPSSLLRSSQSQAKCASVKICQPNKKILDTNTDSDESSENDWTEPRPEDIKIKPPPPGQFYTPKYKKAREASPPANYLEEIFGDIGPSNCRQDLADVMHDEGGKRTTESCTGALELSAEDLIEQLSKHSVP